MTGFAIVVPLFDKAAFVGDAIASIARQQVRPDALIVVDDASTDGGAEVAARALALHAEAFADTRVELVRRPVNGGPGAARNDGIARAGCELLLCLDADDLLHAAAVGRLRRVMDEHALALAVIGYASEPAGEAFPDLASMAGELDPVTDDLFLLPDPLRTAAHPDFVMGRASNVVVRRHWLGRHRYADARLNEGVDLWYRVLRDIVAAGAPVGLVASPLIRFRIVPDSLSHRRVDDWRALEVPPTLLRYRDGDDPRDRRMAAMLAARWRDHALAILPEAQGRLFLAHHRDLFA